MLKFQGSFTNGLVSALWSGTSLAPDLTKRRCRHQLTEPTVQGADWQSQVVVDVLGDICHLQAVRWAV